MQLAATLQSLSLCLPSGSGRKVVVFKASSAGHREGYDALSTEHPDVEFREEDDFQRDLVELVGRLEWILFAVDDTVFVRPFNLTDLMELTLGEAQCLGVSLRLGRNTVWCYSRDVEQTLPEFAPVGEGWLQFNWTAADGDFGYPLEVSSSFYRGNVIRDALEGITFSNPNELEAGLQLSLQRVATQYPGLICPSASVAFSVPLNKVQSTFANRSGSGYRTSAEYFQRLFKLGFRIDSHPLQGFVPRACHELVDLPLRKPELGEGAFLAEFRMNLPDGRTASAESVLQAGSISAEDLARLLEIFDALDSRCSDSDVPPVLGFIRRLLSAREMDAEVALERERRVHSLESRQAEQKLAWLNNQVRTKDHELSRALSAFAAAQDAMLELGAAKEEVVARLTGLESAASENTRLVGENNRSQLEIARLREAVSLQAAEIKNLVQAVAQNIADLDGLQEANDNQARRIALFAAEVEDLKARLRTETVTTSELRSWLKEVEAARDWHNERCKSLLLENSGLRARTISEILWGKTLARIVTARLHAGGLLQKLFRLERPPQVIASVRRILSVKARTQPVRSDSDGNGSKGRPGIVLMMPFVVLGGAERVLSQICDALFQAGFEITVVTSVRTLPSLGSSEQWFRPFVRTIVDVSHHGADKARTEVLALLQPSAVRLLWIAGSSLAYDLLPDIRLLRPDIRIVDLLFNEVGHTENNRLRSEYIDIHAVENRQVSAWLERHGEKPAKITIIPNGVDLAYFDRSAVKVGIGLPRPGGGLIIGYLGRLSQEKGPDHFIDIAARSLSEIPNAFFIAGVGPLEEALRRRVASAGLAGQIVFMGSQDARSFLAACDVLVIPSLLDGRPNAALEAMAMGVPIVASKVGGLPELVEDGRTGFLCEAGDTEAFCRCIATLSRQRELREGFGRAARQKAELEMSRDLMQRQYVDLFSLLVRGG